jgi:hypothetical protein
MSEFFFTKLSRKNNFEKIPAKVEVYALCNPSSNQKHFIPMVGSIPLSPVAVDNVTYKYCVFAEKILLIKIFDFVPCFKVDRFNTVFPYPTNYIFSKLNSYQRNVLLNTSHSCESREVEFFQTYVPTKN